MVALWGQSLKPAMAAGINIFLVVFICPGPISVPKAEPRTVPNRETSTPEPELHSFIYHWTTVCVAHSTDLAEYKLYLCRRGWSDLVSKVSNNSDPDT